MLLCVRLPRDGIANSAWPADTAASEIQGLKEAKLCRECRRLAAEESLKARSALEWRQLNSVRSKAACTQKSRSKRSTTTQGPSPETACFAHMSSVIGRRTALPTPRRGSCVTKLPGPIHSLGDRSW